MIPFRQNSDKMSSFEQLFEAGVSILITYIIELSCIVIAVVDTDLSSVNSNINSDTEIGWHERTLRAVLLEDHLSLKECSLWGTRVSDLRFSEHDRLVFQEVEDRYLSDSIILKSALNNTFLEVAVESQDL